MADSDSKPLASRILPYTTVLMVIAIVYVGYVFYSRWSVNREAERAAAEAKLQRDKVVADALGGEQLKLLMFNGPSVAKRGQTINICYGVSNAVSVTVEPHIEDTKPSYMHCMGTVFKQETTYTLTAKDAAGHTVGGSITVRAQ